ncbi:ribokinase [Gordonia sinesedis]
MGASDTRPTSNPGFAPTTRTPIAVRHTGVVSASVAVVGTLNMDLIVTVDRRPEVGETVLGRSLTERPGGKGANQALAAAGQVATVLIGAVGDDDAGRRMRDAQRAGGVNTDHVVVHDGVSGRAVIEVDASGDNRIIVISGANAELSPAETTSALDATDPAIVLTQLESPRTVTEAAATWARRHGRRFALNPSPAVALDADLLACADPLIVNEGEARFYAGQGDSETGRADPERGTGDDAAAIAETLLDRSRSAVITLGGAGVVVATADGITSIAVDRVDAAETTGAGDHFAGILVARLAAGDDLPTAARLAAAAATAYITSRARPAL